MNSLNILSAIGPAQPRGLHGTSSRRSSETGISPEASSGRSTKDEAHNTEDLEPNMMNSGKDRPRSESMETVQNGDDRTMAYSDEKMPLLADSPLDGSSGGYVKDTSIWLISKRIATSVVGALRVVLSAIVAPGQYVIACFYDEEGRFSALLPLRRVGRVFGRRRRKIASAGSEGRALTTAGRQATETKSKKAHRFEQRSRLDEKDSPSALASVNALTSDSELEEDTSGNQEDDSPSKNTRSKALSLRSSENTAPGKKSIRIKLYNEDTLQQRKQRKSQGGGHGPKQISSEDPSEVAAALLKSPPSPGSPLGAAKYPRAPAPPRPLIPRRQPSYVLTAPPSNLPRKTLIIDLDETLIHSMAKGGRMSTGHMVEVKLHSPVGIGGTILGPQIPILYYVHKRPHCDEFLRKVYKWYNLVIFTASVQEYADPVIDWLEQERKYFSGRYYRQHCTYRNGAYIKDISQVEPDLSRAIILDNSPMSYIFHEDNALPIEGWISDPTDNDLLNVIPLLEGLHHVTDVRALLALRLGESAAS